MNVLFSVKNTISKVKTITRLPLSLPLSYIRVCHIRMKYDLHNNKDKPGIRCGLSLYPV